MNKFGLIGLSALLAMGSAYSGSALGQEKSAREKLVGAWLQVSVDVVFSDGVKHPLYGENPKGSSYTPATAISR